MKIFLTGAGGFVGSLLVPALLERGHEVAAIDTFLYGDHLGEHPRLHKRTWDIRSLYDRFINYGDAVIHLACISNDPSFELDPNLGKSVNYDATVQLVESAKEAGVKRFIYASSSSVYGVKPDGVQVTEDLSLEPLTDYSKYKAMGEEVVLSAQSKDFNATVLRPATLCGYAPRLRLDLIVNILTSHAYHNRSMMVYGGGQRRPNLHVRDMVRAYVEVLEAPTSLVAGQVFNVGANNERVLDLACKVQNIVGGSVCVGPDGNDPRSYMINSDKIAAVLGFKPEFTIEDAIRDLCAAFAAGKVPNAMTDPRYYNIKQMQTCHIS